MTTDAKSRRRGLLLGRRPSLGGNCAVDTLRAVCRRIGRRRELWCRLVRRNFGGEGLSRPQILRQSTAPFLEAFAQPRSVLSLSWILKIVRRHAAGALRRNAARAASGLFRRSCPIRSGLLRMVRGSDQYPAALRCSSRQLHPLLGNLLQCRRSYEVSHVRSYGVALLRVGDAHFRRADCDRDLWAALDLIREWASGRASGSFREGT
jgi:hypothetical protein